MRTCRGAVSTSEAVSTNPAVERHSLISIKRLLELSSSLKSVFGVSCLCLLTDDQRELEAIVAIGQLPLYCLIALVWRRLCTPAQQLEPSRTCRLGIARQQ